MPLAFLAPLFLGALAALAVPIIVHLIQRERKEAQAFPSLMFLSQVPYKSTRRRNIRNVALFLLRSAALALIVLAFARPWFEGELDASSPLANATEKVILVDRSYSMGYSDRWDRALAAANGAIDGVGPEDVATIVFFDGGAMALNQATSDHARLRATLVGVQPGSGVTRYGPGLKLAQSILDTSDKPRRQVIVISDFQRAGWDGGDGVRMPAGTEVTPVAITDEQTANIAVAGVTLRREDISGRERVTAIARLINTAVDPVADVRVTLELNGRDLETMATDIGAGDAATVTFAPFTLADGSQRGSIRVETDALPADDAFRLVLSPGQAVDVLVADGGGQRSTLYLERALGIGDQPRYRTTTKPAGNVRAADFEGQEVVIWNDAAFPGGATGAALGEFVRAGGGLILVLGPRGSWESAGELFPATVGRVVDRDDPGGAFGFIDYGHAMFEVFRAPRSGDLSAARFFRYRPVTGTDAATEVLARFDDGAPAILERRVGAGRVVVMTSTLDNYWSDLPVQPVFLPMVHQLTRYSAGWVEPSPWFTVGQVVNVAGPAAIVTSTAPESAEAGAAATAAPVPDLVAIAPGGDRIKVPTGLLSLEESGFYEVRTPGSPEVGRVVAVNVDLNESDLVSMDAQELVAAVRPRGDAAGRAADASRVSPVDRERRQAVWWYLLIVAFVFLAVETVWANRISRRRTAAG